MRDLKVISFYENDAAFVSLLTFSSAYHFATKKIEIWEEHSQFCLGWKLSENPCAKTDVGRLWSIRYEFDPFANSLWKVFVSLQQWKWKKARQCKNSLQNVCICRKIYLSAHVLTIKVQFHIFRYIVWARFFTCAFTLINTQKCHHEFQKARIECHRFTFTVGILAGNRFFYMW